MSWLLDTNVLSELMKGPGCDPRVTTWFASATEDDLYVSVLVFGEMRKGVELVRTRNSATAARLARDLEELKISFRGRVIPVDAAIADEWWHLNAIRPLPVVDSLLAATAKVRELTLVTRDHEALHGLGVRVLDPFR